MYYIVSHLWRGGDDGVEAQVLAYQAEIRIEYYREIIACSVTLLTSN